MQRIKAKQCKRFHPDFDYRSFLKKLGVAGKVRVKRIAFGEIVRLTTNYADLASEDWDLLNTLEEIGGHEEGIERYCDSARLQAWLIKQTQQRTNRSSDVSEALEWFWENAPGVQEAAEVKGKQFATALQNAFNVGKRPDERKDQTTISRPVGQGYFIERTGQKKFSWSLKGGSGRECVWYKFWDNGWSAGEEEVYRIGKRYYYTDSSSGDRSGPHDSLQSLLEGTGLYWINEATRTVWCPLHTAEEIASMMELPEDFKEGYGVMINDEEWVCVAPGVLRRAESDTQK